MRTTNPLAAQLIARMQSRGIRSTVTTFGAAFASKLGQLVLGILLARQFGASGYGVFTFAIGLATLASTFSMMGWGLLTLRMIPTFMRDCDWSKLKGLCDASEVVVLCGSLFAVALCLILATVAERLALGLLLGAALTVPFTFVLLRKNQLAAVRLPATGLMFDQGFAAFVVLAALLLSDVNSPASAILVYAVATAAGVAIATIIFRRRLPRELREAKRSFDIRAWMAIAIPSMIGHSSRVLMGRMDVLLLSPLSTLEQVGLFGAAFRVTFILTFPQLVLMTVLLPLMNEAAVHRNVKRLRSLHRSALLFAAVTTLPVTLLIVLFPTTVLIWIFGNGFVAAAPTLVALTLGQQAASFAISYTAVLLGSREKAFGTINVAALLINIVLNLALIPDYGALGSAVGTAVASFLLLVAAMVLSRPLLKEDVEAGREAQS